MAMPAPRNAHPQLNAEQSGGELEMSSSVEDHARPPSGAVDSDFWGIAYFTNCARHALWRGLVVRWLWSLGRFRNGYSAAELSGPADVCTEAASGKCFR